MLKMPQRGLQSSFHSAASPGLIKQAVRYMMGVFPSVRVFTCAGLREGGSGRGGARWI